MSAETQNRVKMVTVDDASDGQRIDNFLLKILKGVPKTHVYKILRKGEVRVNKGRIKANRRLCVGDVVRIPPIRVSESIATKPGDKVLSQLRDAIIFEDNRYLVLNKPSGIAVHGGSGLSYGVIEGLRALRPDAPYLELAHRLDRETSGLLVIAKRRSALRAFQKLMVSNGIDKRYIALVKGCWEGGERRINLALQKNTLKSGERMVRVDPEGKSALSLFKPLHIYGSSSLIEVRIITGRTHQVRVHALSAGHPIAGDQKYGDEVFNAQMAQLGCKRLFLHAAKLRFTIEEEATYDFEAPLDDSLQQLINKLGK